MDPSSLFKRSIASMSTFVFTAALIFPVGFFGAVPLTKAATYTVTNLNDNGAGSLRQAIIDSNGNPGADIINFDNLNGTINLVTALEGIMDTVTINGQQATNITINAAGKNQCLAFQGGAGSVVKGIVCSGGNAVGIDVQPAASVTVGGTGAGEKVQVTGVAGPGLRVNGSATVLGSIFNANNIGISLNGATSTSIGDGTVGGRNLIYSNNNDGLDIQGATTNFTINNNYIGSANGINDNGNGNNGILISGSANGGTIQNNLISGNTQAGIRIFNGTHTIQGNIIGLTTAGADLGNDMQGISLEGSNNIIGGAGGLRNIISGNGQDGIRIDGNVKTSTGNNIQYNYIGTNLDATAVVANNKGIVIEGNNADANTIQNNVVSGNAQFGIQIRSGADNQVVQGNTVGLNLAGNVDLGNNQQGIMIETSGNTIGGANALRNVVSGNNQTGIQVDGNANTASNNIIQYNYIGTNLDGSTAIANNKGVSIQGNNADGNTIQFNVISGNAQEGLWTQSGADNQLIYGNYLGLNAAGNADLGNGFMGLKLESNGNTVGDAADGTRANFIAGNNDHGVLLNGAANNTFKRNVIGLAIDKTTRIGNNNNGIIIQGGSNTNVIGGTEAAAGNLIAPADNRVAIVIDGTAGNGNNVIRNAFVNGTNTAYVVRNGTSNENVAAPTITDVTSGSITGTGAANKTVRIYSYDDATKVLSWVRTVTSDGAGAWTASIPFGTAKKVAATQTTTGGSTSAMSANSGIPEDVTAPVAPTLTSSAIDAYFNSANQTLTGTKEAHSSLLINGVEQVIHDGLATWSYNATLVDGANDYSVVVKDGAGNSSDALALSLTLDTAIPAAPTVPNPATTSLKDFPFSVSATEGLSSILINSVDTGVDTDNSGSASVFVALNEGANTLSFQIQDRAGNLSPATTFTVTRDSSSIGAGGGGSGGGGGSSSVSTPEPSAPSEPEESDEPVVEETPEEESVAGEEEPDPVVSEPTTPEEESVSEPEATETPEAAPVESVVIQPVADEPVEIVVGPEVIEAIETPEVDLTETVTIDSLLQAQVVDLTQAPALYQAVKQIENFQTLEAQDMLSPEIVKAIPLESDDKDEDGVSDQLEFMLGLSTTNVDTDGDGISDQSELAQGLSPVDWDSDGDKIADEFDATPLEYNKPVIAEAIEDQSDSDGDGLSDAQEQRDGTNPAEADSDGDGLTDGEELLNYNTNPNKVTKTEELYKADITDALSQTLAPGKQALTVKGQPGETLTLFGKDEKGELVELGKSEIDEFGKGLLKMDDLKPGAQEVFVGTMNRKGELTEFSGVRTLNVAETASPHFDGLEVKLGEAMAAELAATDQREFEQGQFDVQLPASDRQVELVYHFQSAVLSQTLIADASGQTIALQPKTPLEKGNHTLTIAAIDPITNERSESTEIQFSVDASTTAFVSGQSSEAKPWGMLAGAAVLLAGLSALAIFLRKGKTK